jgi:hypothetical protein
MLVAVIIVTVVPSYQFVPKVFKDDDECAACNSATCQKPTRLAHIVGSVTIGGVAGATVFLTFIILMQIVENFRNTSQAARDTKRLATKINKAAELRLR